VFFGSMLIMATFACYLAVVRPGQIVNLFIGVFVIYLVTTSWITVRRRAGAAGAAEKIALAVALCLCAPFVVLAFQLATGLRPFFKSAVPLEGPILVALYGFTTAIVLAAAADARVVLAGGIKGAPRIARHLWRMCLGLTLAVGSFSTNALPRLLPGTDDVGPIIFVPQLLLLGLLVFWLIRVRFTGWLARQPVADAA